MSSAHGCFVVASAADDDRDAILRRDDAAVRVRPKSTFRHFYSTWTPMPARHGSDALVSPGARVLGPT